MLHLSLLRLPRSHARWRHLDAYQAHQLAWKAFPDVPRGERPFLFSLDHRPGHHSLLVQSTAAPSWNGLDGAAEVRTKTFDPARIPTDRPLRFFLRANPTVHRRTSAEHKRRMAVGLAPELAFARMGRAEEAPATRAEVAAWRRKQLLDWLARQGARGGFRVEEAEPGPIVARRVVRDVRSRQRPMTFHEVEFTGRLVVTDAEAFRETLARGIGRGKAFGYGLLMVRPA